MRRWSWIPFFQRDPVRPARRLVTGGLCGEARVAVLKPGTGSVPETNLNLELADRPGVPKDATNASGGNPIAGGKMAVSMFWQSSGQRLARN